MKKLKEISDKINVRKNFPGYINLWIMRTGWILILLLITIDTMIAGSIYSFSVSCPYNGEPCINPYYVCQYGEHPIFDSCKSEPVKNSCKMIPCDKKYIQPGESFGRTDFIGKHSISLFVLILIGMFTANHIYYRYKWGTWKYERWRHVDKSKN